MAQELKAALAISVNIMLDITLTTINSTTALQAGVDVNLYTGGVYMEDLME